MTSTIKIDNKKFYKDLYRLALPIALQSLMLASVAAADALMLGKVAQDQMTAVSLATQIQFVQNMFLSAITAAGVILGAQYWGKGDRYTLEDIFNMMLRYSGLISLVFFLACEFAPEWLMRFFAADVGLIEIGSAYLKIAGWSYLVTGISQCYLSMMKITEHVKPGALISSGAVLLNVVLNAVFIFGLLGAPRMDAEGAALATTISRLVELALCVWVTWGKAFMRPVLARFWKLPVQLKLDFAKQCLPLLGGALCWGVGFTSYTAIMGHMGRDAAAANSVSAVVRDLICCLCNGIGSAAGIMVGNELGAGRLEIGKRYGIKLKNLSYLIGFGSTGLVLAVTPFVVPMVILTDRARGYLTGMMVIMAFYMIGRCVNTVTINGVLNGGGDTIFDLYSLIVCMWMIAIPLALAGAFVWNWSPLAVYACTCLGVFGLREKKSVIRHTILAGIFAGSILAAVYGMLTYMGMASSGVYPIQENGAWTLRCIVYQLFGGTGAILLAAIFTLACLTTCVGLINSISQYFSMLFQKTTYRQWVYIIVVAAFLICNLGLNAILRISIPVLNAIYPVSIVLILLGLSHVLWKKNRFAYPVTIGATACVSILYALDAARLPMGPLGELLRKLPLYSQGFSWVFFAVAAIAISLVLNGVIAPKSS